MTRRVADRGTFRTAVTGDTVTDVLVLAERFLRALESMDEAGLRSCYGPHSFDLARL